MNRNLLLGIGGGLLVGGLIGYIIGHGAGMDDALRARDAALAVGALQAQPAPFGGMPGGMPAGGAAMGGALPTEVNQRIDVARKAVQANPKDRAAWVALGNDYFDTKQHLKAIEAYGEALKLDPKDPNVLTDQGVMFQELGQADKAIENFEKASKVDPKHVQSVFNLGVVWANDKKDPQKAIAFWKKAIEIAPGSPQAVQAQKLIADLGGKLGK